MVTIVPVVWRGWSDRRAGTTALSRLPWRPRGRPDHRVVERGCQPRPCRDGPGYPAWPGSGRALRSWIRLRRWWPASRSLLFRASSPTVSFRPSARRARRQPFARAHRYLAELRGGDPGGPDPGRRVRREPAMAETTVAARVPAQAPDAARQSGTRTTPRCRSGPSSALVGRGPRLAVILLTLPGHVSLPPRICARGAVALLAGAAAGGARRTRGLAGMVGGVDRGGHRLVARRCPSRKRRRR